MFGLFKKKEEDFNLDDNPFGDENKDVLGDAPKDRFADSTHADPLATDASADPFASPDTLNASPEPHTEQPFGAAGNTPDPFAATSEQNPEVPSQPTDAPSRGAQMAHDYINKPTQPEQKSHDPLEMINLKLDGIKTKLENIELRLRKIENIAEKKSIW